MTPLNAEKYIKNAPNIAPKESSASERILKLCSFLGNPQRRIKYIRLAGSNGKTVCARMIISVLNKAQIKNGCLSMPVHSNIRENILIDGVEITPDEMVKYVETVRAAVAQINAEAVESGGIGMFRPTAHEILLCMALLAFVEHECALCIIESDHKGEDPSRALSSPLAAIICGRIPSGERLEIAKIRSYIRRGITEIVSAPQNEEAFKIISDTCASAGARLTWPARKNFEITGLNLRGTQFLYKGTSYSLHLCGKFQTVNALVAIESAEMIARFGYKISSEHIKSGIEAVEAPCKFEVLSVSPTIIADSTHTDVAIGAVCDSLADFKSLTGTNIRLCLPEGELVQKYIDALTDRGYSIEKVSALADPSGSAVISSNIPIFVLKNARLTAKDALASLSSDSILLISGHSNFTMKLKRELLGLLGFGFSR